MSRPVRYNASGPLSGSIRGAAVNYVVDGEGLDFDSLTGNWAPMAEGAAEIVFVSDSYTLGLTTAGNAYPMFFACDGTSDAAILEVANKLPLSPGTYTTAAEALEDLTANALYFVVNQQHPYEGIHADQMILNLDASSYTSYPKTDNFWYELSGNDYGVTLNNGPTYDSRGWFEFDGTNDNADTNNSLLRLGGSDVYTFDFLVNIADNSGNQTIMYNGNLSSTGFWFFKHRSGLGNRLVFHGYDGVNPRVDAISADVVPNAKWARVGLTYNGTSYQPFINGESNGSPTTDNAIAPTTSTTVIGGGGPVGYLNGKIAVGNVYDKVLSDDEMRQNYFGSKIVTEDLIFMLDADNLVSYESGSTTGYSLTGSNSASLFNGTAYKTDPSPTFEFDGSDDYIELEDNLISQTGTGTTAPYTLEAWFKVKSLPPGDTTNGYSIIGHASSLGFGMQAITIGGNMYLNFGARSNSNFENNTPLELDTWIHVVATHYAANNNKIFINGEDDSSLFGSIYITSPGSAKLQIGWANTRVPNYLNGHVAIARVYKKSFTEEEAMQNYQAEQHRFKQPTQPLQNGLLLWLDAGNQDSYTPASNTWYNLDTTPANTYNFTLLNGPYQSDPRALTFDGIDDTAKLDYDSGLDTANMTIEAWIYAENISTNTYYEIYRKENTNARILFSFQDNGTILSYGTYTTDNGYSEMDVSINKADYERQWVHVAVGYESGVKTMYRNGVILQQDSSQTGNLVAGSAPYYIGSNGGGSEFFNGKIAQFRVYNRRLTTAEIQQNYNTTKGEFGL